MPILLLALAATVAACGGSDDNPTATPNVIGSTGASTTPSGSAAASENWAINGQVSGTAVMTKVTCDVVAGSYQVAVFGKLLDADFEVNPVFPTTASGTLTYGVDPSVFVNVTYGSGSSFRHWNDGSGVVGSGTVTVGANGSGSMQVVVPVSRNSPGAATTQVTAAGKWTCP
ncbi:MAG: hypothetical protein ABI559_02490 [Chloroflexota bacterium]